MSQQTRSEEASPIIPIIVFLVIVGGILLMLLPRAPQRVTDAGVDSTEATAAPEEFDPTFAYAWACASCHGADGRGVEGFGPSLLFSSAVMSRNISGIVELLTIAQPPADPAQGFVHPYRGGYPELTDEQLSDLADYLFTLAAG